jgi:rSAM/selenodomain-associated transferase 1
VLVFAKAPRPGHAKTRLIPVLGPEGAAGLQARLIKHTLSTVKQAGFGALELHGAPAEDDFLRFCAARYGADLVPQCDGDLGIRMCAAITTALAHSASVLLIGTDCPALGARELRHGIRMLETGYDAVFAPTEDGGYALIGLARCDPRLFEAIAWGTNSVMDETRRRLRELDWRWSELDILWDVDTPADYERLLVSGVLDVHGPSGARATGRP